MSHTPWKPIPGDVVKFHKSLSPGHAQCVWIPDNATCDVQRLFKNGDVAIALHDVYAAGKDNRKTVHVPLSSLTRN